MKVDTEGAQAVIVTAQMGIAQCFFEQKYDAEPPAQPPLVSATKPFYAVVSADIDGTETILLVAHIRNPTDDKPNTDPLAV